jgi:hypothetical protein
MIKLNADGVAKIINQKMESVGYEDISTTHTPVLQPLYFSDSGLTATELAERSGMTKQSMGGACEIP